MDKQKLKTAIDELQSFVELSGCIGTQRMFHRQVGELLLASGSSLEELDWFFGDYLGKRKPWDKV